jgi:hypothetical protein
MSNKKVVSIGEAKGSKDRKKKVKEIEQTLAKSGDTIEEVYESFVNKEMKDKGGVDEQAIDLANNLYASIEEEEDEKINIVKCPECNKLISITEDEKEEVVTCNNSTCEEKFEVEYNYRWDINE